MMLGSFYADFKPKDVLDLLPKLADTAFGVFIREMGVANHPDRRFWAVTICDDKEGSNVLATICLTDHHDWANIIAYTVATYIDNCILARKVQEQIVVPRKNLH